MRNGDSEVRDRGEARTFRASRRKWSAVLATAVLFAAGGLLWARSGEDSTRAPSEFGWLVLIFFGLVSVVACWQVLRPGSLTVTTTSIEFSNMGRTWTYELARCGEFRTWRNPYAHQRLVTFDYPGDSHKRWARANRRLAGVSSALPDTYGMSADELAALLNDARRACHELDSVDPSRR